MNHLDFLLPYFLFLLFIFYFYLWLHNIRKSIILNNNDNPSKSPTLELIHEVVVFFFPFLGNTIYSGKLNKGYFLVWTHPYYWLFVTIVTYMLIKKTNPCVIIRKVHFHCIAHEEETSWLSTCKYLVCINFCVQNLV